MVGLKIKTAVQARKYIEAQGVKIEEGEPYNIYECGCVIKNSEDPQLQAYYHKFLRKNRTCPNHIPTPLLNKYKKCTCGREYLSKRLQSSIFCKACYHLRGKKKELTNILKERRVYRKSLQNSHLADIERWDCKHRSACLNKYMNFEAIPCKNCKRYEKESCNVDFMDFTWRHVS